MTKTHTPHIAADGYPTCSCGGPVSEWYPTHAWETALVCIRTQTAIADRLTADRLYELAR